MFRKLDRALRPVPMLLSKRAAAKLLGVDRATTLEALIRTERIRTVQRRGPPAFPRTEFERVLAAEVEVSKHKRRRAPRAKRSERSSDDPDELRRLDLGEL